MMSGSCAIRCPDDRQVAREAERRPAPRLGPGGNRYHAPTLTDYTLYDESGRRLGTISAAERQPAVGTNAPTFYLRRTLEEQAA